MGLLTQSLRSICPRWSRERRLRARRRVTPLCATGAWALLWTSNSCTLPSGTAPRWKSWRTKIPASSWCVIFDTEEETVSVFSLSSTDLLSPYLVEGGSRETTHFHMTIAPVLHKAVNVGLTISVTNRNARWELYMHKWGAAPNSVTFLFLLHT